MRTLGSLARDWLPPAVTRAIRRALGRGGRSDGGIRFEGDFVTWKEAAAQCSGYASAEILARVLRATLIVKNGEAAFERDSVTFDTIEYAWPALSGLLLAAARDGGRLHVLDFGGALGSHYFQNRKFLEALQDVRWNVVEQAHYADAGRAHMQDDTLRFYATIDSCLAEDRPNVIVLSGVLQYLAAPYEALDSLLAVGAGMVIIDRTGYVRNRPTARITIQHVPEAIYPATLPCRFLVEEELSGFVAARGYRVLEIFESIDDEGDRAEVSWKGHLFLRSDSFTT
jgi:putative methyltransferase (TIGR04325 family)